MKKRTINIILVVSTIMAVWSITVVTLVNRWTGNVKENTTEESFTYKIHILLDSNSQHRYHLKRVHLPDSTWIDVNVWYTKDKDILVRLNRG